MYARALLMMAVIQTQWFCNALGIPWKERHGLYFWLYLTPRPNSWLTSLTVCMVTFIAVRLYFSSFICSHKSQVRVFQSMAWSLNACYSQRLRKSLLVQKSGILCFAQRYGDLIKQYEVPLSRMLHDILDDDHLQWHPPLIRHYTNFWPYYWSWTYNRIWLSPNCERFP